MHQLMKHRLVRKKLTVFLGSYPNSPALIKNLLVLTLIIC